MSHLRYQTPSGIFVTRQTSKVPYRQGLRGLLRELDQFRGCYFSSGYEYPGRYSRWDFGTVKPPLEVVAAGREILFRALNERGIRILRMLTPVLTQHPHWEQFSATPGKLSGTLKPLPELFAEEERSRQPSAFSILRAFTNEFRHAKDPHLALVGAFGFDLLFQFDPIQLRLPRAGAKDLHLFLCDQIWFMDRKKEQIVRYDYDFALGEDSTIGVERTAEAVAPPVALPPEPITSDHTPEEYMANVETVRQRMKVGDYYEVVLRQTFRTPYGGRPSELFERIQTASPSPYEFLIQLGDESLVGASPEMFVRVEGTRVETCPISGTARRTGDPLKDADAIRELLNSPKEESELTMCTDVDRNDKSRVCLPGSVQVIGRRLIESYAGLFHTVDHVEGTLEPGFDSLDAFLTHMWAVTVIGAPKKWAAQAVEDLEKSARGWYGGAIGMIAMNGDINTGITIRTAHLKDGWANYSAGATLLYDSVPEMEEAETRLKATGFFRALGPPAPKPGKQKAIAAASGLKLLLVDNEDCFIHTLANYARQAGATIATYRSGFPRHLLDEIKPDLLLISPGPGRPADFGLPDLIREAARRSLPVFGVCLGLQGIVEAFGGDLDVLDYPMHGKPSYIRHHNRGVFEGLPERFRVGRYHSLHARRATLPRELEVTAESEDGVIMGLRHRELPIEGVQFHPESLLSLEGQVGLELIRNAMQLASRAVLTK
ncbi:MAG: anthranilate synthase component I [Bryobacteraceae bacterium]|nr:anthranilate synthase component I [Bryobacteraceae bacterium]